MLLLAPIGSRASAAAGPATLPSTTITSPNPSKQEIERFLDSALTQLRSDDPVEQKTAREAIVATVTKVTPSPAFAFSYSSGLNSRLAPLANDANWRVRLNAVIAAAKVAEQVKNDHLVPTISGFLKDEHQAVALWAVKGSQFVINQAPSGPSLVPAVLATGKRVPVAAAAAYAALASNPPETARLTAVQDLLAQRITLYRNSMPPDPPADGTGLAKLVETQWWRLQSPQQQTRTAQLMVDLASGVAKQLTPSLSNDDKEQFIALVKTIGSSVAAIAIMDESKKATLEKPGQAAQKLPRAAPLSQIASAIAGLYQPLKTAFPGITVPASPATNPTGMSNNVSGQ